jgi:hypothetical protein
LQFLQAIVVRNGALRLSGQCYVSAGAHRRRVRALGNLEYCSARSHDRRRANSWLFELPAANAARLSGSGAHPLEASVRSASSAQEGLARAENTPGPGAEVAHPRRKTDAATRDERVRCDWCDYRD